MKIVNTITKSALLLFAMVLMCGTVLAQRTITGTVTDAESKEPLIGASILITGTVKGTLTDVDGNYTLSVPADAKMLTITYTGYSAANVTLGAGNVVNVELNSGSMLDEVVVVGYGTLKQREISSAVTSVKAEDFNRGNINDPAQLIQGKVAGLVIARAGGDPNGGFDIRLRGIPTIGQSSSPLIVVDGVAGVDLKSIDPNDIESTDVLKDGSACAIYGTRGSNGVILITTKKGAAGQATVEYNVQVASESIAKSVSIMSASEYLAAGGTDKGATTDWLGEISQTGLSHTHSLAVSGGMRNGGYRFSGNYRDVNGVLRNSGFKNFNLRMSLNQKAMNDRLTVNMDLTGNRRNANYSFQEAFRYANLTNPTQAVKDGINADRHAGYSEDEGFDSYNPVGIIDQNSNIGQENRILASIRGQYNLMDGLSVSLQYSPQYESGAYQEYYSKYSQFRGILRNGMAFQGNTNTVRQQFNSMVNYDTKFGKSTIGVLAGYEYNDETNNGFAVAAGDFLSDVTSYNSIGGAGDLKKAGIVSAGSYKNLNKVIGFLGRVNYSFDDTYTLSASLRREGSTRFGSGKKWGYFPAVSASVDIAKLANLTQFDQLKLRAGFGVTGNIPSFSYRSLALLQTGNQYPFNGTMVTAYEPSQNPNPLLQWETKNETNVGVDFAAMNFRLRGSIDVYDRLSKDIIYEFLVPKPSALIDRTLINLGDLRNRGLELVLSYDILNSEKTNWNSGITLSTYSTSLQSLSDSTNNKVFAPLNIANVGAPGLNNSTMVLVEEGKPLGQIYGPVVESISDQGAFVYKDIDGDGVLEPNTDDRQVLGSGLPSLTLGWTNKLTFGALDVNFLVRGVFGHSLVNQWRLFYEPLNAGSITSYNRVKTELADPAIKNADFNDRYVEKADFVILDNISLGYTLPLPAGGAFTKARIFVNANRPLIWTNYTGVDPEVRFADRYDTDNGGRIDTGPGNLLAPGIDRRSTYVRTRSVAVGLNLTF